MSKENPKETIINGVDTIRELNGNPPKETKTSYNLLYNQQTLTQGWNSVYIAIIPYCFKCKVPLVWHHYSPDGILLHCPGCNRKWTKDKDWEKSREKYKELGNSVGKDG